MNKSYKVIESKLLKFQKKHSLDALVKGLIIFFLSLLIPSVLLLLFESALYIGVSIKRVLIGAFLIYIAFSFVYWVAFPFFRFLNSGKFINIQQANNFIVKHFPEIKDQLLNVFELSHNANDNYSNELLEASIDQKINSIKHLNFTEAINLQHTFKRFLFIVTLFVVFLFLVVLIPGISKGPATRLVYFNQTFFRPSPYTYTVLNDSLKVGKGESFKLNVQVSSKELISDLYISLAGNQYRMNRDSASYYSYEFVNLNNTFNFEFVMNQYHSNRYEIIVLPKPVLQAFKEIVDRSS